MEIGKLMEVPEVRLVNDDILQFDGDAIVNPAHPSLLAGSGLCGVIHRAAGPDLERAASALGPCRIGDARITPGFRLAVPWVIHAVGPRWLDGTRGEIDAQHEVHTAICRVARDMDLKRIALPAIGVGLHRFPPVIAARISFDCFRSEASGFEMFVYIPDKFIFDTFMMAGRIG